MKTWFITGANRGIGLEIARAALASGDQVVATARDPKQITNELTSVENRLLALRLDVTDQDSIQQAIETTLKHFKRIDVLVNNAGYGQLGFFEQLSPAAIEKQFATNVFGVFAVTRAVLPVMRAQRSGHVISLSSIGGIIGFPGSSIYCATKFALEGWSESLGMEVGEFGINTTLIEPGMFRTDFLDNSSVSYGDVAVEDYEQVATQRRTELDAVSHKQAGDPAILGKIVVQLAAAEKPPARFGAGSDAYKVFSNRAELLRTTAETWRELSISTDIIE